MNRRSFLATTAAAAAGLSLVGLPAFADDVILMRDLYNKDLSFSDLALANEGKRIAVSGYMAPPLKAESTFFVLTKMPMSICPFCDTEADWPSDILAIYARDVISVLPYNIKIVSEGELELGTYRDPELGFVSRIRLVNATYRRA